MVEGQFDERYQSVPEVEGESDVNRSEGRDYVIFGSSDKTFSRIRAMIIGCDILDCTIYIGRREKRTSRCRSFVVRDKVSNDVVVRFEESEDGFKGRDVCLL